jgi:uncharacterized protein (DUF433 family)
MNWRERIESDPETVHGQPHVRGTDVPVSDVLGDLAARMDSRDVLKSHPGLSEEDMRACLAWAANASQAAERAPAGVVVLVGAGGTGSFKGGAASGEAFARLLRCVRTLVGGEMEGAGLRDVVLVYDRVRHAIEVKHLSGSGEMTERRPAAAGAAWEREAAAALTDLLHAMPHQGGGTELAVLPAEGHEAPATQTASTGTATGFKHFLRSMPNVGDDTDFERPLDYGRPEIEWDT